MIGMKRHDGLPEWEELCAVAMSVQNIHLVCFIITFSAFGSREMIEITNILFRWSLPQKTWQDFGAATRGIHVNYSHMVM